MSTAIKKEHKSARPERGGLVTFVEAIRQGIWEEMERDPSVFVIGEDVGAYGGAFKVTDGLIDEFGKGRVIDTPISEGAIVGAACGAALMGMRPVAEFQFIDFISAGFDLLTNSAASRVRGAEIGCRISGPCGSDCAGTVFNAHSRRSFLYCRLKWSNPRRYVRGLIKAAIAIRPPYLEHKKTLRLPPARGNSADDYVVEIGKATPCSGTRSDDHYFRRDGTTALDSAETRKGRAGC